MVFQEISSFTPILLVIFIWQFYRVVRHLQNYSLVKIALQVPLLVDLLESNSTLLYCLDVFVALSALKELIVNKFCIDVASQVINVFFMSTLSTI